MANVLVVDDDYAIREMCKYFLIDSGHSVETAANGNLALEKLNDFIPDIMLLDISMPLMNGIEFLKNLERLALKDVRYVGIPFLVFTGEKASDSNLQYSFQKNPNCKTFLAKTTPLETVAAIMKNILKQNNKV